MRGTTHEWVMYPQLGYCWQKSTQFVITFDFGMVNLTAIFLDINKNEIPLFTNRTWSMYAGKYYLFQGQININIIS